MKLYPFLFLLSLLVVAACGSTKETSGKSRNALLNENTFLLKEVSADPEYAVTKKKPVMVGGVTDEEGPLNERRYLNALRGPNGEKVTYNREGSCCAFDSKNGLMGKGLLDIYLVSWEGSDETVTIYINMYDFGQIKAPKGFTIYK